MTIFVSHEINAQETRLSKSIDKSFKVSDRMGLDITNKYGSVIIDTWSRDEVSLKIEIVAYGKDASAAEKLIDRVEFDFKQSSDFLEIESVFDRKKSFFKDLLNAVSDYSASLLSKHKLQVNYELTIPENASSITVDNRFGDVHMNNTGGRLNVTIAHGNFRANELKDYSRLNVSYGKAKMRELHEANMSLKGAELELEFAGKLDIKSSSSTIIVNKALEIDLESTNDKIEIDEVADITGSANFTDLKIYNLSNACRLTQNYGEMTVKNISDSFGSIRLNGKSTDYVLVFSNHSRFEARIYARDDKLKIADYPGQREKRYMDDRSKFVRITGNFGANVSESKLDINAQNGEVSVNFTEVQPETYNK